MYADRYLTVIQHEALTRLAKRDPDATVIGWDDDYHGPVILTESGTFKVLPRHGYLRKHPTWEERETNAGLH